MANTKTKVKAKSAAKSTAKAPVKTNKSKPAKVNSSEKLIKFLTDNATHKKDFAEMIGVTLSYIYNLIDNNIGFSTRTITLERIAIVMDVSPEDFCEYKPSDEPKHFDSGVEGLKEKQKKLGMSNLDVLKKLPRSLRLEFVDVWRGAAPLPLDWNRLSSLLQPLKINKKELFKVWKTRMEQYLMLGGIDIYENGNLLNTMFECAKKHLKIA